MASDNISFWERTIEMIPKAMKQLEAGDLAAAVETVSNIFDEEAKTQLMLALKDVFELTTANFATLMKLFWNVSSKVLHRAAIASVIASASIAVKELVELKQAWAAIDQADNVVQESRKNFDTIRSNMSFLEQEADYMKSKMEDIDSQGELYQLDVAIEINERMTLWQDRYRKTLKLINNIKVKIGREEQMLNLVQFGQDASCRRNALQSVNNLAGAIVLAGSVHPGIIVAQGALAALFALLAIQNRSAVTLTKEKLQALRDTMCELERLDEALETIFDEIRKIEGWYFKFKRAQMTSDRAQARSN